MSFWIILLISILRNFRSYQNNSQGLFPNYLTQKRNMGYVRANQLRGDIMFRRLYAITDRVTLGYPYSENIPDGDRIEEVRSYHHATPQELTRDSIQEANDLKN